MPGIKCFNEFYPVKTDWFLNFSVYKWLALGTSGKKKGVFQKYHQEDDLFSTRFSSPDDAGYGTTQIKQPFLGLSVAVCLRYATKCFIPCKLIRWMALLLVPFYGVHFRWHDILTFSHNPSYFQTNVCQTLFYRRLIFLFHYSICL